MASNFYIPESAMAISAHPDDNEFTCVGTLARWIMAGTRVIYVLCTSGDVGIDEPGMTREKATQIREAESLEAARIAGINQVVFLREPDGLLQPTLELRKKIVREIRKHKPEVLLSGDPTIVWSGEDYINHPDHRAAAQAALDAAFPAAGNPLFYPELLSQEGLQPHSVKEIWISLTQEPNIHMDVTDLWETKIRALCEHKSQIGEPQKLAERMRSRYTPESTPEDPRYEETFKRVVFPG